MPSNPLLTLSSLPNHAPAFEDIKTAHYLPAIKEAIEMARADYEAIKNNAQAPSFENTIEAMEQAGEMLGQASSIFYNQLSCMGGDDLHALTEEIGPITSNFSSDIILDEKIFARVKAVYDVRDTLELSDEQATVLDNAYKSFVRGGALLNEADKKRLREINEKLSTLGPAFMNNANKSAEAFELVIENKDDLSGLPDSAVEAAAFSAAEKGMEGQWRFTLDYPSYIPFVQYADDRVLREQMWRAFGSRAYGDEFDNCANIKTIITLRDQRAKLLGYKTHADYVLERRMAEKPATVLAFLEKLKAAYKPAAQNDLKELQDFAKAQGFDGELMPWDFGYYSEKLKQSLFDFSSEDLRPYFQLDKTLDGCFAHFSKLFNIEFKPASGYQKWHEDVKVFELSDKGSGDFIGTLFADFHPRTGKKQGAWMTSYREQGLFNGKIMRPVTAIVCNFTKPTKDKPSLITHGEVTTLFHEMGHAIHGLLSDVTYPSVSGTSVLWDFVELPSQVQENWCYEKETLDMFARHYETGEAIPEALINKLRAAMNFMVGWGGLRQIGLGTLDMKWHTANPDDVDDVAVFEDAATKDTSLFPRFGGPASCSFSHIFAGGYSSGYYSYKWAEVLDADTFELFLERGLYDQKTAKAYRDEILSRGGSQPPAVLYKNFRGRDADPEALLRRQKLLKVDKAKNDKKVA